MWNELHLVVGALLCVLAILMGAAHGAIWESSASRVSKVAWSTSVYLTLVALMVLWVLWV